MGRLPSIPRDPWEAIQSLSADVERRLRATHLGRMTARGGGSQWADTAGSVHTVVGDLGDGTVGLNTDGRVAAGGLSTADHNSATNVPTLGGGNGAKVWVQSSDPGGAAANGDLWFQA